MTVYYTWDYWDFGLFLCLTNNSSINTRSLSCTTRQLSELLEKTKLDNLILSTFSMRISRTAFEAYLGFSMFHLWLVYSDTSYSDHNLITIYCNLYQMLVLIYVGLIIMWSNFIIWLCSLILVPCLYNYAIAFLCKEIGQCGRILSMSEEASLLLRQKFSSSTLSLSLKILNECFSHINNITLNNGIVMPNFVFLHHNLFIHVSI